MLSYRNLVLELAAGVGLAIACGSDPRPAEPCKDGRPDFHLLVTAGEAPLPADLVITVEHGGGEEDYVLASPANQAVIFCNPADREGNGLDAGATDPPGGAGAGGEGGSAGAREVDALWCEIWSFGSARVFVKTLAFPMVEPLDLTRKKGVCTGEAELDLVPPDAGS